MSPYFIPVIGDTRTGKPAFLPGVI